MQVNQYAWPQDSRNPDKDNSVNAVWDYPKKQETSPILSNCWVFYNTPDMESCQYRLVINCLVLSNYTYGKEFSYSCDSPEDFDQGFYLGLPDRPEQGIIHYLNSTEDRYKEIEPLSQNDLQVIIQRDNCDNTTVFGNTFMNLNGWETENYQEHSVSWIFKESIFTRYKDSAGYEFLFVLFLFKIEERCQVLIQENPDYSFEPGTEFSPWELVDFSDPRPTGLFSLNRPFAQSSDSSLYPEPFRLFISKAYQIAYDVTGDNSLADEALSTGVYSTYKVLNSGKKIHKLGAYFTKVVHREACRLRKQEEDRIEKYSLDFWRDDGDICGNIGIVNSNDRSIEDKIADRDIKDRLRMLINSLPEKESQVIFMFYFDEYSCEVIASRLNLTTRAIEGTLYRARNKLRKLMKGSF